MKYPSTPLVTPCRITESLLIPTQSTHALLQCICHLRHLCRRQGTVGTQGQWIDVELPENLSFDFAKLVMRMPQFLTEAEQVSSVTVHRASGANSSSSSGAAKHHAARMQGRWTSGLLDSPGHNPCAERCIDAARHPGSLL